MVRDSLWSVSANDKNKHIVEMSVQKLHRCSSVYTAHTALKAFKHQDTALME